MPHIIIYSSNKRFILPAVKITYSERYSSLTFIIYTFTRFPSKNCRFSDCFRFMDCRWRCGGGAGGIMNLMEKVEFFCARWGKKVEEGGRKNYNPPLFSVPCIRVYNIHIYIYYSWMNLPGDMTLHGLKGFMQLTKVH